MPSATPRTGSPAPPVHLGLASPDHPAGRRPDLRCSPAAPDCRAPQPPTAPNSWCREERRSPGRPVPPPAPRCRSPLAGKHAVVTKKFTMPGNHVAQLGDWVTFEDAVDEHRHRGRERGEIARRHGAASSQPSCPWTSASSGPSTRATGPQVAGAQDARCRLRSTRPSGPATWADGTKTTPHRQGLRLHRGRWRWQGGCSSRSSCWTRCRLRQ